MEYRAAGGVLWAKAYIIAPPPVRERWAIAWGIRFPTSEGEWWGGCFKERPSEPLAFVSLMSDPPKGPRLPLARLEPSHRPEGWLFDVKEHEAIAARPADTFRQNADGWTEDFADWVIKEIRKAIELADHLVPLVEA